MPMNPKTLEEEVKRDNNKVTYWLLNYTQKKKEIEQLKEDLILSGSYSLENRLPVKTNLTTDPTAKKVILLVDKLAEEEKWLKLIEEVEQRLPVKLRLLLQLRRQAGQERSNIVRYRGRPSWIPYVQCRYCEMLAKATGKEEEDVWIGDPKTFFVMWNRIVEYTCRLSGKRGLLN